MTQEMAMEQIGPTTPAGGLASILRSRRRRALRRDLRRGYRINYKQVVLAFGIETVVVATSLLGALFFAQEYAKTPIQYHMMLLAPIAYAMVEFSRVPLAISVRTQTSYLIRALALLAVLCAAGVTVKSVSQLGELMFRPRLTAVLEAKRQLVGAEEDRATLDKKISDADAVVSQQQDKLTASEERLREATKGLAGQPGGGQACQWVIGGDKKHKQRFERCTTAPTTAALSSQLKSAQSDHESADQALKAANQARAALDRTTVERNVTEATDVYREAVSNSQLHSFTAMVFGKDPAEVTEAEIAKFLRVFVFLPAILVSLASTLLAMTAVQRLSPKRNEQSETIADEASGYFLRPLAAAMVKVAREAMESAAERAISNARATDDRAAEEPRRAEAGQSDVEVQPEAVPSRSPGTEAANDSPARPWPVAAE
jgi:hypothetical protein